MRINTKITHLWAYLKEHILTLSVAFSLGIPIIQILPYDYLRQWLSCCFIVMTSLVVIVHYFREVKSKQQVIISRCNTIDITIHLKKKGEIWKEEYVVVHMNTHFDTVIGDANANKSLVSEETFHGIFLQKMEDESKLESLRREISMNNEREEQPIGTVISYDTYLLWAFSQFDDHNHAYTTSYLYEEAFHKLFCYANQSMQGKTISMPLVGGGLSRWLENVSIEGRLFYFLNTALSLSLSREYLSCKMNLYIDEEEITPMRLYLLIKQWKNLYL